MTHGLEYGFTGISANVEFITMAGGAHHCVVRCARKAQLGQRTNYCALLLSDPSEIGGMEAGIAETV
jgi:hypothetical protein